METESINETVILSWGCDFGDTLHGELLET